MTTKQVVQTIEEQVSTAVAATGVGGKAKGRLTSKLTQAAQAAKAAGKPLSLTQLKAKAVELARN